MFLLNAVSGAQQPEEANICIQEIESVHAECSLSRVEGLSELEVFD